MTPTGSGRFPRLGWFVTLCVRTSWSRFGSCPSIRYSHTEYRRNWGSSRRTRHGRPSRWCPARASDRLRTSTGPVHRGPVEPVLAQLRRGHPARTVLQPRQPVQLAIDQTQFTEPARGHQHPTLQRAHRLVVGGHRPGQRPAQPLHVSTQGRQPAVQLLAQVEHLTGVLAQRLLLPGVLRRPQQRDERGRRRDVHTPGHGLLQQPRVAVHRPRPDRRPPDEAHHQHP